MIKNSRLNKTTLILLLAFFITSCDLRRSDNELEKEPINNIIEDQFIGSSKEPDINKEEVIKKESDKLLIPKYFDGEDTIITSAISKRDLNLKDLSKEKKEKRLQATADKLDGLDDILWNFANEYDDNYHIGTYNYGIDYAEHSCHTLGFLLHGSKYSSRFEKLRSHDDDFLKDLKLLEDINTTEYDIGIISFGVRLFSTSVGHYVSRVKDILEMTEHERVELWNLDCVEQFDLGSEAYVQNNAVQSANFVHQNNGFADLRYTGEIDNNFYDKLVQALKKYPDSESLSIGSGGGSVVNAMAAGYLLKAKGIDVRLHSDCYSACPLVFIAGERRIMEQRPRIKLGFHQMYSVIDNKIILAPISVYNDIQDYIIDMDPTIDTSAFIDLMLSADPNNITYPEYEYLCSTSIASWVQRNCSAPYY